jgi:hypothetical protein
MPSTNYYAIEINFSGAGSGIGNYASYVSGASVAITAIGGGVVGSGNNQNQVGGVTLTDTNGWTGDHSEILLYDHVITAGERTTLQTYINGKFAL